MRSRKLFQDLEATDTENCGHYEDQDDAALCWKKKRAALELQKKQERSMSSSTSSDCETEDKLKVQTRDKLLGALALMELSGVPISTEAVLREAEVLMPIAEAEKVLNMFTH